MTTRRRATKRSKARIVIAICEKWRLELQEACALVGVTDNYLRELEGKGEFPPRVHVRSGPDDEGGKLQFIASEVRAWADGRDWRALVAARQQVGAHAS